MTLRIDRIINGKGGRLSCDLECIGRRTGRLGQGQRVGETVQDQIGVDGTACADDTDADIPGGGRGGVGQVCPAGDAGYRCDTGQLLAGDAGPLGVRGAQVPGLIAGRMGSVMSSSVSVTGEGSSPLVSSMWTEQAVSSRAKSRRTGKKWKAPFFMWHISPLCQNICLYYSTRRCICQDFA